MKHNSKMHALYASLSWIRRNAVLCIAIIAAAATAFIVHPDAEYLGYFDFKTLSCLFCTLAVVCALKNIKFFTYLSEKIIVSAKNLRMSVIALVCITFIGSMFIANDMALLTFLPLGFYVMKSTGNENRMAFVFIMQNIAANLGGMLTPFGNPQNLYIYTKFGIGNIEFMKIMAIPFALSVAMIILCCALVLPRTPLEIKGRLDVSLPKVRTSVYLVLFVFTLLIVFRVVPWMIGLGVILASMLFLDRSALWRVDYPLLLTFCAFFIFSGNMSRISAVDAFLSSMLEWNTLLTSVISCQFISNVPSAILLSEFTENYKTLLVGVNIGGAGTLIASLASLITFREYTSNNPGKALGYIGLFSLINFAFLGILTLVCSFIY